MAILSIFGNKKNKRFAKPKPLREVGKADKHMPLPLNKLLQKPPLIKPLLTSLPPTKPLLHLKLNKMLPHLKHNKTH